MRFITTYDCLDWTILALYSYAAALLHIVQHNNMVIEQIEC